MSHLEELHKAMLDMLVDIDRVCRKNNIAYFLSAGTLLGAVRHQGFIPWDDDADIMMPRKDYDRFLSIAANELGPYYFVQYHDTEPYYRHTFAKIRRNGTACIIQDHRHIRMHQGIFVDVFPLENVYCSNTSRKLFWWIGAVTDKLCALSVARLPEKYRWLSSLKWIVELCFKPSFFSRVSNSLIRAIQPEESSHLLCVMGSTKLRPLPISWIGKGRDAPFGGRLLRVPDNPESYLQCLYGDFMRFPPVDQRMPAHAKDGTQVSVSEDYRAFIPELYGDRVE